MRILLIILTVCSLNAFGSKKEVVKNINDAAVLVGVDAQLLLAVCFVESSYREVKPRIDGHTNSYGICQVKLETARYMDRVFKHRIKATSERLQNSFVNAFYAAKVIKYQLKRYGDTRRAVEAYNKGNAINNGQGVYVAKVFALIARNGE